MKNHSRIILALDGMTFEQAKNVSSVLKHDVAGDKANDLLDERGADVLNQLSGQKRMADPKIKDIPNTVFNRVKKYVGKADFVTIHGTNSFAALKAAKKAAAGSNLKIIVVTVTTDIGTSQCRSIFGTRSVKHKVIQLVSRAKKVGLHGIVCSPKEVAIVREAWPKAIIIVPGVRSPGADVHDQKRVGTPEQAFVDGANWIVCGREICEAGDDNDMIAAAKRINDAVLTGINLRR